MTHKKKFMAPFYGWGSAASRLQPLGGGSLLFTPKFLQIPGTNKSGQILRVLIVANLHVKRHKYCLILRIYSIAWKRNNELKRWQDVWIEILNYPFFMIPYYTQLTRYINLRELKKITLIKTTFICATRKSTTLYLMYGAK